jgi:hypothetical protein
MRDTYIMVRTLIVFSFFLFLAGFHCSGAAVDSMQQNGILVIPYQPGMHLSDADQDIADYSEKNLEEVRRKFREGIVKDLHTHLLTVTSVSSLQNDHVGNEDNDEQYIYHATYLKQDTIWPVAHPQNDSSMMKRKISFTKNKKPRPFDKLYMNVGFYDEGMLADLGRKYNVGMIVFLNELDIKTNAKDCIDLANKIYDRELKLHYSVFDVKRNQIYGDIAVVHMTSAGNDIDEILLKHVPGLTDYIMASLKNLH